MQPLVVCVIRNCELVSTTCLGNDPILGMRFRRDTGAYFGVQLNRSVDGDYIHANEYVRLPVKIVYTANKQSYKKIYVVFNKLGCIRVRSALSRESSLILSREQLFRSVIEATVFRLLRRSEYVRTEPRSDKSHVALAA